VYTMHVSKNTVPKQLAGAIFNALQEHDEVKLVVIGNGALGAAVKGLIVAKGFFSQRGQELVMDPHFDKAQVPDKGEVVAISIIVQRKE